MKKLLNFVRKSKHLMKKFEMFKYFLLKHIKSKISIELISINLFSHLNEHVSNFGAVSTQVRVTLWKDNRLYMNKDKQYLLKLMRPEDR